METVASIIAAVVEAIASFFQGRKANTDKQAGMVEQQATDAASVNQEVLNAKSQTDAVTVAAAGDSSTELHRNWQRK